ncbi:MAG: tRNA (adenosine(37)-N6)-dimethylallyltransferase MiaA [Pseudomonadota bacterium]|nr:tRNA (adenosine(37)-N6)-dimethylallyltransferase MiaA [Pseudomonadota bacterium]
MRPQAGPPTVLLLMGPTAAGKSALALAIAQRVDGEIVSVDSAAVYRGMDAGTAKPDARERAQVPHHLIDVISPLEAYSAARFRDDALAAVAAIHARGHRAILAGGTMLYFRALLLGLDELPAASAALRAELDARAARLGWPALHAELARVDPVTAARLEPADAQRIQRALEVWQLTGTPLSALHGRAGPPKLPWPTARLALEPSQRAVLHERIARRFDAILAQGLVDELAALRRALPGLRRGLPSMRCVGYRQAWEHLDGEINAAALRERGIVATRQLAKRQLTWLRGLGADLSLDCLRPDLASAGCAAAERLLDA